jgi:uncharacterized repeat protein (TIGR01451 family)
MKNINSLVFALTFLSLTTISSSVVMAQYVPTIVSKNSIVVDKKIRPIDAVSFSDNLSSSVRTLNSNEQVEFQIVVTNNGTTKLSNISVKDTLPKYLGLIFYPGIYNSNTNVLTWNIDSLNAGESKSFLIRSKINGNIPSTNVATNAIFQQNCVTVNVVGKASDSDCSKYYVNRPVAPITGTNDIIVGTMVAVVAIGSAVGLRKAARGY